MKVLTRNKQTKGGLTWTRTKKLRWIQERLYRSLKGLSYLVSTLLSKKTLKTPNALLDAEANRLRNAKWYELNLERQDTRAGRYRRSLDTKAGFVTLNMPKIENLPFETAIIQRY